MARLYSNENFPLPVIAELRRLGHDVLTIQETGMDNRKVPDPEVLNIAHTHQRALLTLNRKDFRRLHYQSPEHSGIILCTRDIDFIGQAKRIHEVLQQYTSLAGQLIRVNRPQG